MRMTALKSALPVGVLLIWGTASAWGTAAVQLSDGSSTVTLQDNGVAGCVGTCTGFAPSADVNVLTGAVTFSGSFDNYIINVTTGLTKPVMGSPAVPSMDLNTVDTALGGSKGIPANTLTVKFTDTDFTAPSGTFSMKGGGTSPGSGSYKAYFDTGNSQFVQGTLIGTVAITTGAFSGTASGGPVGSGNYSLTQVLTVNFPAIAKNSSANFSGDFSLDASEVPEPASVSLLGGVLLFTFGALRRKLRRA